MITCCLTDRWSGGKIEKKTFQVKNDTTQKPLLIVLGDHGMSDSGSHGEFGVFFLEVSGGNSDFETQIAMAFMSPVIKREAAFIKRQILQLDVAATISWLTNTTVPTTALSVPVVEALVATGWTEVCYLSLINFSFFDN